MGGVSPVLYLPVVPARLVKTSADAKFSAPRKFSPFSVKNPKFYLGFQVSYHYTENLYMITIAVQIQLPYSQAPKWRPSSTLGEVARIWL